MGRVVFITGTDTAVGKTAITALLLAHAQSEKINVRALKPFSSGDRGDAALLEALQSSAFAVNFFHYPEPLSPWSAARLAKQCVSLSEVLSRIAAHQEQCDLLLIEGAGGLLTPIGEGFTAADIIVECSAETVVVAADRLGVLNHTRLTAEALRARSVRNLKIALVEQAAADVSRKTNLTDLRELLEGIPITAIPFLESYRADAEFIRRAAVELRRELAELLAYKKNPPDTEAEGTFPQAPTDFSPVDA
jgi:dethiobiotin synthetase